MKKERGLYKRSRSPYWWMCYTDKHGNTVRESTEVKEKSLAREILNKKRTLVAEGKFLDKRKTPKLTMNQLCDQYWEKRASTLLGHSIKHMVNDWKEHFGNEKATGINQGDIENFLNGIIESGLSPCTRNHHLKKLKAMFNWGIAKGLIDKNPVKGIKPQREIPRTRYLSMEEIQALLVACTKRVRQIVEFALNTGMRKGEIFDLQWTEIDRNQDIIWVKTSQKGDPRPVPVNENVARILDELPKKSLYVFTSPRGGGYYDIKKGFKTALKDAKILDCTFHDLRHTFASHLVMNGVRLEVVAEILGHSTVTMTKRYAHLAPDFKARSIGVLDKVFKVRPKLKRVK